MQSQCSPCSSTFSSSDQDALSIGFEKPYSTAATTTATTAASNDDVYGILLNVDDSLSLPADISAYDRSKYITQTTSTTIAPDTLPPVSHFSTHSTINQQQSHNYTVTKCYNERLDSPSPPSSDCSSSLESPAPILPCKARSKMHEMAVKQRLITDQDPRGNGFIQLSAEEKRTLLQEGYSLPTRLPLTKSEEDALKIVRRKIKNKLSAQESRRKRKEYMDTLEQRVQLYFSENSSLKAKIKQLEHINRSLNVQLKKMQAAMNNGNVVGHSSPPCLTAAVNLPHNAGSTAVAAADTTKTMN